MSSPNTPDLMIIGAVDDRAVVCEDTVNHLLAGDCIAMAYGHQFTGKPGTKVYVSEEYILKLKTETELDFEIGIKWVKERLVRERRLGIYHPSKTWLLLKGDEGYWPANVCKHLLPLHLLLVDGDTTELAPRRKSELLLKLIGYYLRFAQRTEHRLDEGLSNFALDGEELYYVDDDIYEWDNFHMFSHALGIYFRSVDALAEEDEVVFLAQGARTLIDKIFDTDPLWYSVIAEQLRHQFFPPELKSMVATFIDTLHPIEMAFDKANVKHEYLAILADVHANSWAFSQVLEQLRREGVRDGIIAGDIVGYGPEPNACVELAAESGMMVVQGNHDHAVARGVAGAGFSATARWSFDWTMSVISTDARDWLASLPPVYEGDECLVVHGAPVDPTFFNAYVYQMTYESNLNWMQKNHVPLCFHGHSHIHGAYLRERGFGDRHITDGAVEAGEESICLFCPGSVGQPRESAMGAQYAIYDVRRRRITFHDLEYDHEPLYQRLSECQFPEKLSRLFHPA